MHIINFPLDFTALLTFDKQELSIYTANMAEMNKEIQKAVGNLSDPEPTIELIGNSLTIRLHGGNRGIPEDYQAAFKNLENIFKQRGIAISEEGREGFWTTRTLVHSVHTEQQPGTVKWYGSTPLLTNYSRVHYQFDPPGASYYTKNKSGRPWIRQIHVTHANPGLTSESLSVDVSLAIENPSTIDANDLAPLQQCDSLSFDILTVQDLEGFIKTVKDTMYGDLAPVEQALRNVLTHCMSKKIKMDESKVAVQNETRGIGQSGGYSTIVQEDKIATSDDKNQLLKEFKDWTSLHQSKSLTRELVQEFIAESDNYREQSDTEQRLKAIFDQYKKPVEDAGGDWVLEFITLFQSQQSFRNAAQTNSTVPQQLLTLPPQRVLSHSSADELLSDVASMDQKEAGHGSEMLRRLGQAEDESTSQEPVFSSPVFEPKAFGRLGRLLDHIVPGSRAVTNSHSEGIPQAQNGTTPTVTVANTNTAQSHRVNLSLNSSASNRGIHTERSVPAVPVSHEIEEARTYRAPRQALRATR